MHDVPLLASSDRDPRCSRLKLNVSGLLGLDKKGAAATSVGAQVKYCRATVQRIVRLMIS